MKKERRLPKPLTDEELNERQRKCLEFLNGRIDENNRLLERIEYWFVNFRYITDPSGFFNEFFGTVPSGDENETVMKACAEARKLRIKKYNCIAENILAKYWLENNMELELNLDSIFGELAFARKAEMIRKALYSV